MGGVLGVVLRSVCWQCHTPRTMVFEDTLKLINSLNLGSRQQSAQSDEPAPQQYKQRRVDVPPQPRTVFPSQIPSPTKAATFSELMSNRERKSSAQAPEQSLRTSASLAARLPPAQAPTEPEPDESPKANQTASEQESPWGTYLSTLNDQLRQAAENADEE